MTKITQWMFIGSITAALALTGCTRKPKTDPETKRNNPAPNKEYNQNGGGNGNGGGGGGYTPPSWPGEEDNTPPKDDQTPPKDDQTPPKNDQTPPKNDQGGGGTLNPSGGINVKVLPESGGTAKEVVWDGKSHLVEGYKVTIEKVEK